MTSRQSAPLAGAALALAAAAAYGVTVVIGHSLSTAGVDGSGALAIRFGLSAVVLAVVQLLRRRPLTPPPGERVVAFLLGSVGYALESTFFFLSLGEGTAAAATMLFYSYPAIVAVTELVQGRIRPSLQLAVALAATVVGAIVVTAGDEIEISAAGVVYALIAAASFSAYLLVGDAFAVRTDAVVKAMWVSGGASLSLAVRALVIGAELPGRSRTVQMLGYGAANAAAFGLMFAALGRIGPTRTAVVLTFELVAAVVLAAIFLDEPIGAAHVVGGIAVLSGAILVALLPARPQRVTDRPSHPDDLSPTPP